ncbi:uncharacterized protein LOC134537303 [Bacillus rossius redtenbacheri]|uniref:uncharacterized protein LOC134537303 n=1 Tax=Bacillus rossius redtenbacheri TaxID=93214 RepID=UPI002FDECFAC
MAHLGTASGSLFSGDGRKIRVRTNHGLLHVCGDRTRLKVEVNLGTIVYTGRRGRVEVARNLGCVRYLGDGGVVQVGRASAGAVVYSGSGGSVLCPGELPPGLPAWCGLLTRASGPEP